MTDKEKELQEEFLLEEQQLSEEEQELLETIYDRLDIYEQQNRDIHKKAKIARRILHMDDPEQDNPLTLRRNGKKDPPAPDPEKHDQ